MISPYLLLVLIVVLPVLTYLCAKLAGYGWVMGKWKAFRKLYQMRNDSNGDEKGS